MRQAKLLPLRRINLLGDFSEKHARFKSRYLRRKDVILLRKDAFSNDGRRQPEKMGRVRTFAWYLLAAFDFVSALDC